MYGPSLPFKVAKTLNTEILFASAHLADLTAQGKVKISNLKIGGSPLYYLPGQEQQLHNFATGNLNPKDYAVLNKLKEQQVWPEKSLELLEKVALRNLKDFAVPLQVTVGGKAELFWKWHLLSEGETNEAIERLLNPLLLNPLPAELKPEIPEKLSPGPTAVVPPTVSASPASYTASPLLQEEKEVGVISGTDKKMMRREHQKRSHPLKEDFFPDLERLFRRLAIIIDKKETIRREKELNFLLKVPSAVGPMSYFCKAKNKSKCDEKDLSAAYMEAQVKKLPLLFLHTGELSKKAQEMLKSGVMENVMVRKVE